MLQFRHNTRRIGESIGWKGTGSLTAGVVTETSTGPGLDWDDSENGAVGLDLEAKGWDEAKANSGDPGEVIADDRHFPPALDRAFRRRNKRNAGRWLDIGIESELGIGFRAARSNADAGRQGWGPICKARARYRGAANLVRRARGIETDGFPALIGRLVVKV